MSTNLVLAGKALPVTELADGDLLLEGLCAVFAGEDAEGENFAPGAFAQSTKAFLEGSAPLCFNHKPDKVLGKVLDLKLTDAGLWMRARVDGAIRHSAELRTLYEQIKRGTISGLSIGGWFKRTETAAGPRISSCRFSEISATAIPIHEKPAFEVVAGKALEAAAIQRELGELEALRDAYGELALADCRLTLVENFQRARR